ncbi:MAG TPA: type II toxin-antitoxin system VapC family toxin [Acidimicrobiales bacterium]|nr:type II toxin-antitoxin system VapC family toxin [Acidimicrobiales bacterium]
MIVVDTSAIVDALIDAPGSDVLRARLVDEDLHAPTLLDYEVVAALRGLTLGHKLSPDRSRDALADFDDLRIRRWPSADALRARTFALRENLSAYDAAFVALAESLDCALVTRDARLARSVGHDAKIRLH